MICSVGLALRFWCGRSTLRVGVGQAIAGVHALSMDAGGKSGLHRTGCQVTPGGREPTESAAESRPLTKFGFARPGPGDCFGFAKIRSGECQTQVRQV